MHGLVNRGIQEFVCHTYGRARWIDVCREAGIDFTEFEPMMRYDRPHTPALQGAMVAVLERPLVALMEDFGTYLVTDPAFPAVRRLLRFSGVGFQDFLHALDDLPDRVRLAVPDLRLPHLSLHSPCADRFLLRCAADMPGYGSVMTGILRAMADDYGALALIDHQGTARGKETIAITLVEAGFSPGRDFELGRQTG
ncbi:MAG: heme NO-binding domain-containing protein [Sulfitobacter sp.]|nr:heme NO-binding domain-containing protein [Sulfitobacter sp.]